jgi:ubiquitin-protein ligase
MDIARIQRELADAQQAFALVELRPTTDGKVYAKTALQTAANNQYVLSIKFPDSYPNEMPRVYVDAPVIGATPHKYDHGNICFMHSSLWNPGIHNLKFVIWRAAKWLNKYEVWRVKGKWPGAQILH